MSKNPHSDSNSLRFGGRITLVAEELRALGGETPPALDGFLDVQERLSARVGEYLVLDVLIRQLAIPRKAQRAVLVDRLQTAWDHVRTVGTRGSRKPLLQVEKERQLLFPFGRPLARTPGDRDLISSADTLVSLLTADSALARSWPADNLAEVLAARDAFLPAFHAWDAAVQQRATLTPELGLLRLEWYQDLRWLRECVKRTLEGQGLPNRYASLFKRRSSSAAKTEPEAEPGSSGP